MRVIILVIFFRRVEASYAMDASDVLSCHVGLLSTCIGKDMLQSHEQMSSTEHLVLVMQGFLNQQR